MTSSDDERAPAVYVVIFRIRVLARDAEEAEGLAVDALEGGAITFSMAGDPRDVRLATPAEVDLHLRANAWLVVPTRMPGAHLGTGDGEGLLLDLDDTAPGKVWHGEAG